jgi:hypothetical protein
MSGLNVKIEESEKMAKIVTVMIKLDFMEKKEIVETFQYLQKLIENEDIETFNKEFTTKVEPLFNSSFGSGFVRSYDEYYKYLYYYENKNKKNSDNRDFTEDGWRRFFQHHSFKNLQKHVKETFNNDIKKINKELPQWFVRFLGMCFFENN